MDPYSMYCANRLYPLPPPLFTILNSQHAHIVKKKNKRCEGNLLRAILKELCSNISIYIIRTCNIKVVLLYSTYVPSCEKFIDLESNVSLKQI